MPNRLLIIQVAGLGYDFLVRHGGEEWAGLRWRPTQSVFPAVTCTVQASFRTAAPPSSHGMVFNGAWSRELRRPMFWEQSSALVAGPRMWEGMRTGQEAPSPQPSPQGRGGKSVGLLFWQQSLGEEADVLLSPAPMHKHHGGMIEDVYSRPAGLYQELVQRIGRRFKLMSYWGPLASAKSSQWIAAATTEVMKMDCAPDLLLTYLPHLDYPLLRHGPSARTTPGVVSDLLALLGKLLEAARATGYEVIVFGDYAFADASRPLYPNRLLLEKGLLATRDVRGRLYPDFHYSRAFAVADHEVAHVYVQGDAAPVAEALRGMDGVDEVLTEGELVASPNAGDIILVAEEGAWFAYPWWTDRRQQPDYATHVDIHNKPGFDPCELFFGWPPISISTDATRVRGSHGRVGKGREIAWAASFDLGAVPRDLIALAKAVESV